MPPPPPQPLQLAEERNPAALAHEAARARGGRGGARPHDVERGLGHVVAGVHGGVGGRDDGHQVRQVALVAPRVPDRQAQRLLADRPQQHRDRPRPARKHLRARAARGAVGRRATGARF